MGRPATGTVVEKTTSDGATTYALRFRALGERQYVTLGRSDEGWTRARAEDELVATMALVRRGLWQPPADHLAAPAASGGAQRPAAPAPRRDLPTFHVFASEWWESAKDDLQPKTHTDYLWRLQKHLLPFFHAHRLDEITVREIDRYRDAKVRDGVLGAESINKTLTLLGQVLERAVEHELLDRNPMRIGRRKLKQSKGRRSFLDDADQVADLIAAAGLLDAEAHPTGQHLNRRAMLATLAFTGMRINEVLGLRWRHVDLPGGRITTGSKTEAGHRWLTLQPALREHLVAHRAGTPSRRGDTYVFPTSTGKKLSADNVRDRTFNAAVARANEEREQLDLEPLPDSLTPHSMRRTYVSALFALGWELPVVMAEVGHADPKMTLGVYAQVMRRSPEARERLAALLEGRLLGTIGHWTVSEALDLSALTDPETTKSPISGALREERATGFEPATFCVGGEPADGGDDAENVEEADGC